MSVNNDYKTITIKVHSSVCFIKLTHHYVSPQMVSEMMAVLSTLSDEIRIVVLEGNQDVFCLGADFSVVEDNLTNSASDSQTQQNNPEQLYDLWSQLQQGDFISIAHVEGKVNAGGVGFVAACDIVIANQSAEFSLSELLFGLLPACVIPFLRQRIGKQKSHLMTLSTQNFSALEVHQWGLVDFIGTNSSDILRRNILRMRRISTTAIGRYKRYINELEQQPQHTKAIAIATNRAVLSDPMNIKGIVRYQREGLFPWE